MDEIAKELGVPWVPGNPAKLKVHRAEAYGLRWKQATVTFARNFNAEDITVLALQQGAIFVWKASTSVATLYTYTPESAECQVYPLGNLGKKDIEACEFRITHAQDVVGVNLVTGDLWLSKDHQQFIVYPSLLPCMENKNHICMGDTELFGVAGDKVFCLQYAIMRFQAMSLSALSVTPIGTVELLTASGVDDTVFFVTSADEIYAAVFATTTVHRVVLELHTENLRQYSTRWDDGSKLLRAASDFPALKTEEPYNVEELTTSLSAVTFDPEKTKAYEQAICELEQWQQETPLINPTDTPSKNCSMPKLLRYVPMEQQLLVNFEHAQVHFHFDRVSGLLYCDFYVIRDVLPATTQQVCCADDSHLMLLYNRTPKDNTDLWVSVYDRSKHMADIPLDQLDAPGTTITTICFRHDCIAMAFSTGFIRVFEPVQVELISVDGI